MTTPALIDVRGVAHAYGTTAVLDGIDLRVEADSFVALVGPSGCGKSTLLRAMAGLVGLDRGTIRVADRDVVGHPGSVALHPQRDLLMPWKRAVANATVGAEIAGVDRAEARRQAAELWARFGLAGFEAAWPSQLSGGMRQRLALLRTFLVPRPVLLLDEPFGALDAITRRELQRWLGDIVVTDRRTVVLVTHDVEEAVRLADRVVVMSDRPGRVVADIDAAVAPGMASTAPAFVAIVERVLTALADGRGDGAR